MKRHFLSALAALTLAPVGFAIVDINQNGVSDFWEKDQNNGELFPESFDPQADSDSDGWTNAQEAAAGTHPFDSNPPGGIIRPEIVHVPAVLSEPDEEGYTYVISPEAVTVSWPTLADKQYTLLFSLDLAEGSWIPVGTPFIGNGNEVTYGFQVSGSDKRFWRVKAEDADTDGDTLTDIEERLIGSSVYLADTDGDGLNDAEAFAVGMNPSGDGSDEDGDGIPDNEMYSVVFEIQHESHSMPLGVGWASYDETGQVRRYLTKKETEKYSVSGSAQYPDVTDAEHVRTHTILVNGTVADDGQGETTEQGTTFHDWKSSNQTTLGAGELLNHDLENRVTTVEGPTVTPTQIKTVTTTATPWTIRKDGKTIRDGTETIVVTEQVDLCDEITYQDLWNTHVKARPWNTSPPSEFGPLEWMEYHRWALGEAEAAEYIRERFIKGDFTIFGTISDPGMNEANYGSDNRLKQVRWRWVKFNPQSPFGYEYTAPPEGYREDFHLLVRQTDVLDEREENGNPSPVDETNPKGVINIECLWNKGGDDWEVTPLATFNTLKIEDPVILAALDYSKTGYSHVWFDNLPAAIIPGRQSVVSADDHTANIVFQVQDNHDTEGSVVEWQIESGTGGSLSQPETMVKDGFSAVTLNTSTVKDARYVVQARIKKLGSDGDVISQHSAWIKSSEIEVKAGKPHTFAFAATKTNYRSDGTDTSEITATIKDQYGNLVEDGTSVSWGVDQTPTPPFDSMDNVTADGLAKAVLHAPLIPESQVVTCKAGDKQSSTSVAVQRVTGSLAGNLNLDLGANQSSTLAVTAQAADGTPVYWTTSNGSITAQSEIANGTATATLSSNGGRLGAVAVTATAGDRMFVQEGQFTSTSGIAIGVDHPVLIAGATSDGISTPAFAHGIARQIPYYASTPVRIKGSPGATIKIAAAADQPLDGWALETLADGVTPSHSGLIGHEMLVVNAEIDAGVFRSGIGSLAFAGNGHGSVPVGPDFQFADQFTASVWLRPSQHSLATLVGKSGAWELKQLADGCIQASVTTDTGTYSATTSQPLPVDQWTSLALEYGFQQIRIRIGGATATKTAAPGTLVANAQPILVGVGFHGHLDEFSLRKAASLNTQATLSGLGTNGNLLLDADGEGTFTVTSAAAATSGTAIQFAAKAEAQGGGSPSFGAPLDDPDIAEKIVEFADAVHWDATYDTVMSFVGGDPQTTQGTVASIAGGILVVGDVGSTVKNLWRMTSWSEKEPNYVELSLGGLGVLTTFVEATGAGTAADAGLASVKTLAMRFANNPVAEKFLTVFIEQIKNAAVRRGDFGQAEVNFLKKMVTDIPVSDAFKVFVHDDALAKAAVNAAAKLGDNAESFYQGVRKAVASHGEAAGKSFVQTFENLSDEAFAALKEASAAELDEALEGLAMVANKGITPFALSRVLNNTHLYGTAYKRTNLLKDLGELADVPNLKGLESAISMLKTANVQAKGFRYEIEGAAWLARNEKEVVELTKRFSVVLEAGANAVKTDIDVVIKEGGKLVYYQFKRSTDALGYGKNGLEATESWVAKAMKDLELQIPDYSRIKYALPEGVTIPPQISKWFDALGPPSVEIVRIPHLD